MGEPTMLRAKGSVVLFLGSAVFSAHAATAQVVGGSIGGVVTDEQASVLPGVSLTLCESRAFSKLDASDRTHAAIIGLKRGIIEL